MGIEKIINKPYVVVLGSGKSINDLSDSQIKMINKADVKIAINKFGAFYDLAGITPTHIYFYDDYDNSAILFLKYIFSKFRKEGIRGLTFLISKRYKGHLFHNKIFFQVKFYYQRLIKFLKRNLIRIGRYTIKLISVSLFNRYKKLLGDDSYDDFSIRNSFIPKDSKIHYIETQTWNKKHNFWAKTLDEKLYHYRGSLTSVLNYISISYPNQPILLVGVDFNSFGYFFSEKMLNELPFKTKDWTTEISRENNKHFSIIDYKGTKMDDEFPFVIDKLKESGNIMYSISEKSYLVEKGFVKYIYV